MRKFLIATALFCFCGAVPALAQDSSRLADLNEDVATHSRREAKAQRKVEKQERKLERKREKLERRKAKTNRRERKRDREQRRLDGQQSYRGTAPALFRKEAYNETVVA